MPPLTTRTGHRLGTLCVIDHRPRHDFGPDDVLILREMAALAMDEIEGRLDTERTLAELEKRKRADRSMSATRDELEVRIAQRTTALVEAEARYRGIFENAVEGIYQARPGGGILSVNPAFAHLLGYASPEALLAAVPALGLLHVQPAERAGFEQRLAAEGTITNLESEIYRCDGERIWISENARAIRDGDGRLLRYEGTVEDISARRRAEEALQQAHEELEERVRERTAELALLNGNLRQLIAQREHAEAVARRSENKFRALVENAQDLTSIITPDGVLVYNTPSVEHILGLKPDDLLGKNIFDGWLHPDEHEAGRAHLQRIIETGEAYVRTECRLRHRDGSWRRLESITSPLPADFPLFGVVVNSRDITERRHAEREAQARTREQTAIAELGRHALQGLDLPEIFDRTVRLVAEALGVPLTTLNELQPDGRNLPHAGGRGLEGRRRRQGAPQSLAGAAPRSATRQRPSVDHSRPGGHAQLRAPVGRRRRRAAHQRDDGGHPQRRTRVRHDGRAFGGAAALQPARGRVPANDGRPAFHDHREPPPPRGLPGGRGPLPTHRRQHARHGLPIHSLCGRQRDGSLRQRGLPTDLRAGAGATPRKP